MRGPQAAGSELGVIRPCGQCLTAGPAPRSILRRQPVPQYHRRCRRHSAPAIRCHIQQRARNGQRRTGSPELRAKLRAINAQTPRKTGEHQRPESKTNQQLAEPCKICKTSIPGSHPGGGAPIPSAKSQDTVDTPATLLFGMRSFFETRMSAAARARSHVLTGRSASTRCPLR